MENRIWTYIHLNFHRYFLDGSGCGAFISRRRAPLAGATARGESLGSLPLSGVLLRGSLPRGRAQRSRGKSRASALFLGFAPDCAVDGGGGPAVAGCRLYASSKLRLPLLLLCSQLLLLLVCSTLPLLLESSETEGSETSCAAAGPRGSLSDGSRISAAAVTVASAAACREKDARALSAHTREREREREKQERELGRLVRGELWMILQGNKKVQDAGMWSLCELTSLAAALRAEGRLAGSKRTQATMAVQTARSQWRGRSQ